MTWRNSSHDEDSRLGEVTIADVARTAGVSISTVSRYLNNKPDLARQTRQRIEQAIAELGYVPHAQAQRLAAGRSRTIALLYPFDQPGSLIELDFVFGAAAAAAEKAYFFNLMMHPLEEENLISLYRRVQVDGVILLQVHSDDWRVKVLRQYNYPFVMLGRTAENEGLTYVDLDFDQSIRGAFEHLVALGHREIGFINYPPAGNSYIPSEDYGPAVRASQAYEAVLGSFGLRRHEQRAEFNVPSARAATLALLKEEPGLTGIVLADGARASGVVDALRESRLRIPEDISLVGLTTHHIAELITPWMTVMDFPSYDMGYQAARMLIRVLTGEAPQPEQVLVQTALKIGESSAPPGQSQP